MPNGESMNTLDPVFAEHGVFGRAAGIARSCAEDVDFGVRPLQGVLEQVAEQLHRHVLEGQRRPVGQPQDVQARLQRTHWRDVLATEHLGGVGFVHDGAQVRGGDVVGEAAHDFEREVAVIHAAQRGQLVLGELGISFGDGEAAVGGEPAEQNFGEGLGRHAAAGADIFHAFSSSSRIRTTLPEMLESASIFAIA